MNSTGTSALFQIENRPRKAIIDILSEIRDPGLPRTIVDMGMVSEEHVYIIGQDIQVEFRPSSPFCPMAVALGVIIKHTLEEGLGREVEVRIARGSHLQAALVNELLEDRVRYLKALRRLKSSGFVARCRY